MAKEARLPIVRLIFVARYPVLLGLILAGLGPLAHWLKPDLLGNLLVLDRPVQLFNVTWVSLLVATLVIVAFRIVQSNARERFTIVLSGGETPHGPWRIRWLLWLGMGLAVPIFCVVLTLGDLTYRDADPKWWPASHVLAGFLATLMVVLGVGVALFILLVLTALQQYLLHPQVVADHLLPFESWAGFDFLKNARVNWLYWLGDKLAVWLDYLGPGYTRTLTDKETGKTLKLLAPGHAQATLWFSAALVAYVLSYLLAYPGDTPDEALSLPALFYALEILILFGTLLSGLAFLLDYYRVPVLAILVGVSAVSYGLRGIDHFYALDPPSGAAGVDFPAADAKFTDIADHWHLPEVAAETSKKTTRTLVVVTAAGGGIQAAAWTTRVLAGLDEIYGGEFTRSIGLISAVSGGSVGTMYYLANGRWTADGPPFGADGRRQMQDASRASCLEATGWGLAYPDLMRTFFPFVVQKPIDRGWAMEQAWGRWPSVPDDQPLRDVRLRQWLVPIREGRMPAVVFNATLVETGQRLVISPVLGPQGPPTDPTAPRQFFQIYSSEQANPRITTAVRLSATFPYVSPISRPLHKDGSTDRDNDYHVADGGYADNEGMATVIDWISDLLMYYVTPGNSHPRPFDRILVIRIFPFPTSQVNLAETSRGWLYALLGPAKTIGNVRTASQADRNRTALELLIRAAEARRPSDQQPDPQVTNLTRRLDIARAQARRLRTQAHIEQERAARRTPGVERERAHENAQSVHRDVQKHEQEVERLRRELVERAEITWTAFVCLDSDAPLSWKLTAQQKSAIDMAWKRTQSDDPLTIPPGLKEPPLKTLDHFFSRVNK
jgi:hypothetical protein